MRAENGIINSITLPWVLAMTTPFDPANPYAAPIGGQAIQAPRRQGLPGFAMAMFIIDLVFCVLRLPMVMFGFVGYAALKQGNHPLFPTVAGEIASGMCMVLFGLPANILGLLGKRWAVWFGVLSLIATAGSIAVGIWQATIKLGEFAAGSPEQMGGYVGMAIMVMIRLALAGAYIGALVQFAKWANRSTRRPDAF